MSKTNSTRRNWSLIVVLWFALVVLAMLTNNCATVDQQWSPIKVYTGWPEMTAVVRDPDPEHPGEFRDTVSTLSPNFKKMRCVWDYDLDQLYERLQSKP